LQHGKKSFIVLLKQRKFEYRYATTSPEAICDAVTQRPHPPIPAPSQVESYQAKQLHLKTTIIASLSILILSKTYPTKVTSSHVGFLARGFVFAKKQLKSWVLTFNILARFLVRLSLLSEQLIQPRICTTQLIHAESSHSSIITGYHGQVIKQSRITVRGRQSIDSYTLQGNLNTRSSAPKS
jgi:hypothetical protein